MLPLARSLARRYAGKGEPLEDLEQVASLGLLKAIDRFDVSRDVSFATFAVPTIAGELKRHFRDRGWMLRVPREVQELSAPRRPRPRGAVADARPVADLASSRRRSARRVEQVPEAMRAADAYRMMSLDEPLADGAGPLEAIGGDDHGFELAEHRILIKRGLPGSSRASARSCACATTRGSRSARSPTRRDLADARLAADPPLDRRDARRSSRRR